MKMLLSSMRCPAVASALVLGLVPGLWVSRASADGEALQMLGGVISSGVKSNGAPVAVSAFHVADRIYYFSTVGTGHPGEPAGTHQLSYKWYTDDRMVFTFGDAKQFSTSPFQWSAWISGVHLGEGHHRVELYIDDKLFDSRAFDIVPANQPVDSPPATLEPGAQAQMLLIRGDFQALDDLASQARQSKERLRDGTWKLTRIYDGVDAIDRPDPTDPEWVRLETSTQAWLAQHPNSATTAIFLARLFVRHAWLYRGVGYASSVSDDNRKEYQRLIGQAAATLDENRTAASIDPAWFATRVVVAKHQGASKADIVRLADEGLEQESAYYPLHFATAVALLPSWGGSEELVRDYVSKAVEKSRATEGTQVYARVYLHVAGSGGAPLDALNGSGAKWPAMQASLDEILRAWPDPRNVAAYSGLACLAGDREAYRKSGRSAARDAPSVGWWDTAAHRKGCDDWAFEGKSAAFDPQARLHSYLSFLRGFGDGFWFRVGLVVSGAALLLELVLAALSRRSRRVTVPAFLGEGAVRTFDPSDYPRTYRYLPARGSLSNRGAIRTTVLSSTIAVVLLTIPWAIPTETLIVFLVCLTLALTGAALIVRRLVRRVVLRPDAVEVHDLFSTRKVVRADVTSTSRLREPLDGVSLSTNSAKPLRVLASGMSTDPEFWLWFDSLAASGALAEAIGSE